MSQDFEHRFLQNCEVYDDVTVEKREEHNENDVIPAYNTR